MEEKAGKARKNPPVAVCMCVCVCRRVYICICVNMCPTYFAKVNTASSCVLRILSPSLLPFSFSFSGQIHILVLRSYNRNPNLFVYLLTALHLYYIFISPSGCGLFQLQGTVPWGKLVFKLPIKVSILSSLHYTALCPYKFFIRQLALYICTAKYLSIRKNYL